jgi:hypothetical protein
MRPQKPTSLVSKQEEKELLEIGEQLFRGEFPNPKRSGCPSAETLRILAFRSQQLPVSERNRYFDHMTCCSPCFAEFSAFVDQARERRRLVVLGICAAMLATIGLATWFGVDQWGNSSRKGGSSISQKPPSTGRPESGRAPEDQKAPEPGPQESRPEIASQQPRIYRNVILDVRDQSVARGESPKLPERKYPKIPRGFLNLSIYLPFGSEGGKYHLKIYKDPAKLLLSTTGIARIRQGITILQIRLDTTQMSPGTYVLESREGDWTSGYQYTFVVAE